MNKKYFYIAMSQQDLLKNQVIEEIIRERNNYYINRENSLNFWIIMSPSFLLKNEILNKIKNTNFYRLKKDEIFYNEKFYSGVILSTDSEYINWLKLRLGYFENFTNNEFFEKFKSDGIYGEINENEVSENLLFETKKLNIHPKILIETYAQSFEVFLNMN
jgi:hypothetical protein